MPRTALLDANVLYSSFLRDFLIRLARAGAVRLRWSDDIHAEWMAALRRARPDIPADRLDRLRQLIDAAVDDARVTGYAARVDALSLPDPGDRHVLAAAIQGGADTIITLNVRDFPADVLALYGIACKTPDGFACTLYRSAAEQVADAAREHRAALRNPPFTAPEYRSRMHRAGLAQLAAALEADGVEL